MLLEPAAVAWGRHLYRNVEAFWPSSCRVPISFKLRRHRTKQMLCYEAGGRVRCPHLARRRREEERDGAMKMSDASESGRAVNMSGKGEEKEEEEGRWRKTRDNADSWAGLPVRPSLAFRLDLQVLNGTLAEAVLENKNRCHKTPLRLGFASVMTPAEMQRVWCSQQKPVRCAPVAVFITSSAATSPTSFYQAMIESSFFFVFPTQKHAVCLSMCVSGQIWIYF